MLFLVALVCAAGGCRRSPTNGVPPVESLLLRTDDGADVAGTLYPARSNAPGLLLVHAQGTDRTTWEGFARKAQSAGYVCLAIDLRGHGESRTAPGQPPSPRDLQRDDWLAALADLDAGKQTLIEKGADAANLALCGAGIGANLVLLYAVEHADVQAVVLVSPGLDYKGVAIGEAMTAYGMRPSMLVTSEGDTFSASSCAALKRLAPGLCELREYPGAAFGTALFDASTLPIEQVLLWLEPIIGPKDADK